MILESFEIGSRNELLEQVEFYRTDANRNLDLETRSALGQFMTPAPVASFMASLFHQPAGKTVRLLDPGAGVGSLTAAFIEKINQNNNLPQNFAVTVYEIDPFLANYLESTLKECRLKCETAEIAFEYEIVRKRIDDAVEILKELGLPKAQQNERSALTLLAITNIKPVNAWREAQAPLMGITPIMDFSRDHYGKTYAPNTRETFRRFTMHQFVEAGIAIQNPDQPDCPINSPKWCYQIEPDTLALLKTHGSSKWEKTLAAYLKNRETLKQNNEACKNHSKTTRSLTAKI